MQEYADPVIDRLDAGRGILARRLFREVRNITAHSLPQRMESGMCGVTDRTSCQSCTQLPNGSYTKDLSIIEQDLSRVCLVDNSPVCYSINQGASSCDVSFAHLCSDVGRCHAANGIPIEGWTNDPHDEALLDLLPVLDSLRFTGDVRRVLGIRGFS